MITITETMTSEENHKLLLTPDKKYISNGEYWLHTDYADNKENYKIVDPHPMFFEFTTMLLKREAKVTPIQLSKDFADVTIHNYYYGDNEEITVFKPNKGIENKESVLYIFNSSYAWNIILPLLRKGFKTCVEIEAISSHSESESPLYIYDNENTLVAIVMAYIDYHAAIPTQLNKGAGVRQHSYSVERV